MKIGRKERKARALLFKRDLNSSINKLAYSITSKGKSRHDALITIGDFINYRIKKDVVNAHIYRSCYNNFMKEYLR